jgi:FkbM family methyltransferase
MLTPLRSIYKKLIVKNVRGIGRVYSFLKKNNLPYLIPFVTKYGTTMLLDPFEYIDSHILKEGYYESEVLEALLKDTLDNACLWDIGANIGTHSIAFKHLKPGSNVVSFEPEPLNFSRLKAHAKLNKLDIQLMNFPLSDSVSIGKFYNYNANHGRATLTVEGKKNYNPHHYVSCTTGDELVKQAVIAAPDIIKLDVEGFEYRVLKGLEGTLSRGKTKKIIFEASGQFLAKPSQIKELLSGLGYKFLPMSRNEATHHNLDNYIAFL